MKKKALIESCIIFVDFLLFCKFSLLRMNCVWGFYISTIIFFRYKRQATIVWIDRITKTKTSYSSITAKIIVAWNVVFSFGEKFFSCVLIFTKKTLYRKEVISPPHSAYLWTQVQKRVLRTKKMPYGTNLITMTKKLKTSLKHVFLFSEM